MVRRLRQPLLDLLQYTTYPPSLFQNYGRQLERSADQAASREVFTPAYIAVSALLLPFHGCWLGVHYSTQHMLCDDWTYVGERGQLPTHREQQQHQSDNPCQSSIRQYKTATSTRRVRLTAHNSQRRRHRGVRLATDDLRSAAGEIRETWFARWLAPPETLVFRLYRPFATSCVVLLSAESEASHL